MNIRLHHVALLLSLIISYSGSIQAELQSSLSRQGTPHAHAKLEAGETVNIVFLGGSITKGGGSHGFSETVPAWLKTQFPKATIQHFNSGIDGTDSGFGEARTDRDVLTHKPDLVFVEFAVNDGNRNNSKAMEKIVRKVWTANPTTDIVFLHTFSENQVSDLQKGVMPVAASHHEKVAEFYNIPTITLAVDLLPMLGKDNANWSKYMRDGCHPSEVGYEVYTKTICGALKDFFSKGKTGRALNDKTLTPNLVLYPKPVEVEPMEAPKPFITADKRTSVNSYHLPKIGKQWRQETDFSVEGKKLWSLYYMNFFRADKSMCGGKCNDQFGLNREEYLPMEWFEQRSYFNGASGVALAKGNFIGSREKDLSALVFVAPETGKYAFKVTSTGVQIWSHHKVMSMNAVHFPWGKSKGQSVAFFKTDSKEKKGLDMNFEIKLAAGEEISFATDTNAFQGGGGGLWKDFDVHVGLMEKL